MRDCEHRHSASVLFDVARQFGGLKTNVNRPSAYVPIATNFTISIRGSEVRMSQLLSYVDQIFPEWWPVTLVSSPDRIVFAFGLGLAIWWSLEAFNRPRRHRWRELSGSTGRCIQCGILRSNSAESPSYSEPGTQRFWLNHAPSCPPESPSYSSDQRQRRCDAAPDARLPMRSTAR
jgi:hypothetical protein